MLMNAVKSIYTPFFTSIDKNRPVIQKTFLAMTAVCSVLSCFRPLRVGTSIGMRSISLLSVGISKPASGKERRVLKMAKLANIALGIAAIAASKPLLMVASVAGDLALQIIEGLQALRKREFDKAFMHVGFIVIDSLTLAGIVLGSWKLMVGAAAVSVFAMAAMAAQANVNGHGDDGVSYLVMAMTNMIMAFTIAEIKAPAKNVVIKNNDPTGKMIVMKPSGRGTVGGVVAESANGQDVAFKNHGGCHGSYSSYDVIHISAAGKVNIEKFIVPQEIVKAAIPVKEIPQLALGSGVLKTVEPFVEIYRQKGPYNTMM